MEIRRDVTLDEDATLKKSRKFQHEETYEELVAPKAAKPMKEFNLLMMTRFWKNMICWRPKNLST